MIAPSSISLLLIATMTSTTVAENPACRDEVTAQHLCDESYRLWDLTQNIDRELDVCKLKLRASDDKLLTMTASTVVHTKIVYTPNEPTTFQNIMAGALLVVATVGGFFVGYLVAK